MEKLVSIIIPTIEGRESWLKNATEKYRKLTPHKHEIIVVHDQPGCGPAWQLGADEAKGWFLHFAADDLEPIDNRWAQAGMNCVGQNKIPAAKIIDPQNNLHRGHNEDRSLEDYGTVPFLTRDMWEKIGPIDYTKDNSIPLHYYTDNWISYRARQFGWLTHNWYDYGFIHHVAPEGRERESERMEEDHARYLKYTGKDDFNCYTQF